MTPLTFKDLKEIAHMENGKIALLTLGTGLFFAFYVVIEALCCVVPS